MSAIGAIEASDYFLRRERPGPDEIRFLSPAALQTSREPAGVLSLYAQWLDWHDHSLDSVELGQVARNVCCSLDLKDFEPLEGALAPSIGDKSSGEHLVRNLGQPENKALLLVPVDNNFSKGSKCAASPRSRVSRRHPRRRDQQSRYAIGASSGRGAKRQSGCKSRRPNAGSHPVSLPRLFLKNEAEVWSS